MNLHTFLLRLVNLKRVDPKVLAQTKVALQSFNARTKLWQAEKVGISESAKESQ